MQTFYPLPDSLWEKVRTTIEPKPRRRKVSLQTVLSGIIYLLSNGCKWRSLPPQYGDYWLVWYYLNQWAVYEVLDQVLHALGLQLRRRQGRSEEPSLVNMDAQAVKTTAGTGDEVGYDAGKKIKGRKRHLATDTQGNMVAAGVKSAFEHDKTGARVLREDVEDRSRVKKIVTDGAYGESRPSTVPAPLSGRLLSGWKKENSRPFLSAGSWSAPLPGWSTTGGWSEIMKKRYSCPGQCSSCAPFI